MLHAAWGQKSLGATDLGYWCDNGDAEGHAGRLVQVKHIREARGGATSCMHDACCFTGSQTGPSFGGYVICVRRARDAHLDVHVGVQRVGPGFEPERRRLAQVEAAAVQQAQRARAPGAARDAAAARPFDASLHAAAAAGEGVLQEQGEAAIGQQGCVLAGHRVPLPGL